MAVTTTSVTTQAAVSQGEFRLVAATIVNTGTYATGGFTLSAAQAAACGADGKVLWTFNDPTNTVLLKWDNTNKKFIMYVLSTGAELANASAVAAGTFVVLVQTLATAAAGPAFN